jgi:hypothetical protein
MKGVESAKRAAETIQWGWSVMTLKKPQIRIRACQTSVSMAVIFMQ